MTTNMQCRFRPFPLLLRTTLLRDIFGVRQYVFTRRENTMQTVVCRMGCIVSYKQYLRKIWQRREYLPAKS
jgi:hypothetical protein